MEQHAVSQRVIRRMELNLAEEQFGTIRQEISDLIAFMHPSKSNRNIEAFGTAVHETIKRHGVEPRLYWEDVWMKSGRKDILAYNEGRKDRATIAAGTIPLETHRSMVDTLFKLAELEAKHHGKRATGPSLFSSLKKLFSWRKKAPAPAES